MHYASQARFKSLQVDIYTFLAQTETSGAWNFGKYAFINLETHGMLWKMVYSNAKHTQFAVNGLKHAKPPVWFFKRPTQVLSF